MSAITPIFTVKDINNMVLPPVGTFVTYSYQPKIDLFGAPSKIVTKGVISAIYPSYFVIDNGLYEQCFNKVDIATGYLVRVA